MKSSSPASTSGARAIPMLYILLTAAAVHGPLLLMQLPNRSFDAYLHQFFADHYAHHWFDPWNPKWYGGFSQMTYPPLQHQWIALFEKLGFGPSPAYMIVQMIAIILLPIGVYRFSRIWVTERAASYAALGSVFLGSLSFLVYQSGQLSTTMAAPLYLIALSYMYEWLRDAKFKSMIKALLLCFAAASAHHVTLLFGAVLFALPVLWTAVLDRKAESDSSIAGVVSRGLVFAALAAVGIGVVLAPYVIALIKYPITQHPIAHNSRNNFIYDTTSGINFFVIPFGAMLLAFPYIFYKGLVERRLRPLFFGFWVAMIFGLGSTTPVPRLLLGRAFEVLTFERFNYWATLLALPIVGLLAVYMVDRFRSKGVVALAIAAVISCGSVQAWLQARPIAARPFDPQPIADFLNRDGHDQYRYLTLGWGALISRLGVLTNASSVDGEYHSARHLPEMTSHDVAQLTNAKFNGTSGMEALRDMLKHASIYGLKWVFLRDRYYEPLLAFSGWRPIEVFENGEITLWTRDDVPPARKLEFADVPPAWHGILWGIFPIGSSVLAIIAIVALPDRRRMMAPISFPQPSQEPVAMREAK